MNPVKSLFKSSLVAIVGVLALAAAPAWAQQPKIGYVNYATLLQESPQMKTIQDALNNEFTPRQRELQTLQQQLKTREDRLAKDGATMTPEQRTKLERELRDGVRDFQRKQEEFQYDVNARRNEEMSRLQNTLIAEVQTYAKAQNFDLVIAEGVIYANTAMDITPAVLAALQARPARPAAATAPAPRQPGR
jgi:outer membrane protein